MYEEHTIVWNQSLDSEMTVGQGLTRGTFRDMVLHPCTFLLMNRQRHEIPAPLSEPAAHTSRDTIRNPAKSRREDRIRD